MYEKALLNESFISDASVFEKLYQLITPYKQLTSLKIFSQL